MCDICENIFKDKPINYIYHFVATLDAEWFRWDAIMTFILFSVTGMSVLALSPVVCAICIFYTSVVRLIRFWFSQNGHLDDFHFDTSLCRAVWKRSSGRTLSRVFSSSSRSSSSWRSAPATLAEFPKCSGSRRRATDSTFSSNFTDWSHSMKRRVKGGDKWRCTLQSPAWIRTSSHGKPFWRSCSALSSAGLLFSAATLRLYRDIYLYQLIRTRSSKLNNFKPETRYFPENTRCKQSCLDQKIITYSRNQFKLRVYPIPLIRHIPLNMPPARQHRHLKRKRHTDILTQQWVPPHYLPIKFHSAKLNYYLNRIKLHFFKMHRQTRSSLGSQDMLLMRKYELEIYL